MHITVYLPLNLLSSCLFVHKPEDLLVCPERAGRLDTCKPPPTLGRILLYILVILMEISLDYIQEEEAAIAIVLIFILGFVGVVLLVEVVLWRVGVLLSSDPRQICLVISVDIGISVRRLGLSVGLLLLIPCVKAALDV